MTDHLAPSPPEPASPGPSPAACSCGRGPHPTDPGRCAGGHPLAGHGAALSHRHGLYAQVPAADLRHQREAFLTASVADDGGLSEVPARRLALHAYRARLHVHIGQLSDAIEEHGLFDRRGRLRTSWLQRLEGLVDRARQIDATLGLTRRSAHVKSAADIVAEYRRGER